MKTLPRVVDDRVSLVLTPQAYHNYDPATDIFNHSAFAYWSMMVPGEDAWGHIVCTGQLLPFTLDFPFWPLPSGPPNVPSCLSILPLLGPLAVPFALCLLPLLGPLAVPSALRLLPSPGPLNVPLPFALLTATLAR